MSSLQLPLPPTLMPRARHGRLCSAAACGPYGLYLRPWRTVVAAAAAAAAASRLQSPVQQLWVAIAASVRWPRSVGCAFAANADASSTSTRRERARSKARSQASILHTAKPAGDQANNRLGLTRKESCSSTASRERRLTHSARPQLVILLLLPALLLYSTTRANLEYCWCPAKVDAAAAAAACVAAPNIAAAATKTAFNAVPLMGFTAHLDRCCSMPRPPLRE